MRETRVKPVKYSSDLARIIDLGTKVIHKYPTPTKQFDVGPEDVVFVPAEHRFAVQGKLGFITFDSPAFYPEQSEEVKE